MLLNNSNVPTRSTRLAASKSSAIIQDENKISNKLPADKKGVTKQRSVLGDISNKLAITKAFKAEKPAVAPLAVSRTSLRVPIFAKPVEKPTIPVPASKPPVQKLVVPTAKHEDPFASAYTQDLSDSDEEMQPENMLIDMACEPIEDIDSNDRDDPSCCTEYVNEIFEYYRQREVADRVRSDYMVDQIDITEKMRAILVDWMVEVCVKFKLLTETLFLSVNLIDRFLSIKPITRTKLQLVSITAMHIAAKYEEIYSPELRDFTTIADSCYTRDEVLRMERLMLTTLDFNLSVGTPIHFLRRYSKASHSDSRTHTLSKYLSELTLTEYGMLKYLPSHIAAASIYVARCMTDRTPWSATLEHYATLREDEFIDCARDINALLKKTIAMSKSDHTEKGSHIYAVYRKYCSERLLSVARLPAVDI